MFGVDKLTLSGLPYRTVTIENITRLALSLSADTAIRLQSGKFQAVLECSLVHNTNISRSGEILPVTFCVELYSLYILKAMRERFE